MDLFNSAIAFGTTPFETIYFQNKIPERLESHYKRLLRASMVLNVLYKESFEKFSEDINNYIQSSNEENGVLKAILLDGKLYFKIRGASYTKEGFREGIKLSMSKLKRDPKSIFTYFKTLNYGENVLEDKRAKKKGYDTCLFLNYDNKICETAYANIFFRKGNILYTPHLRCGILPGVMRKSILEFAKEEGCKVEKAFLSMEDIKEMDEAFITNSVSVAYPIRCIENIHFNSREFVLKATRNKEFNRSWNL